MPPKNPAVLIKDAELASELRVSVMRLSRRLRAERSDEGLTPTQLAVLGTLDRGGMMTLGELAALEKVQPPSMTRTTAALEERGLITRLAHPTDGRQVLLELSRAGRTLLLEDRKRREAWLARRFELLTDDERALLHAVAPVLERLAQA